MRKNLDSTVAALFGALSLIASLYGCAVVQPVKAPDAKPATTADAKPSLKTFTHADLKAAAQYATDHGYPARAAMWTEIDALLTAAENQVAACKAAIDAAKPAPGADVVGLATLTEMGAEAVAQGIPAAVKANCEPIVIPAGLIPVPRL